MSLKVVSAVGRGQARLASGGARMGICGDIIVVIVVEIAGGVLMFATVIADAGLPWSQSFEGEEKCKG